MILLTPRRYDPTACNAEGHYKLVNELRLGDEAEFVSSVVVFSPAVFLNGWGICFWIIGRAVQVSNRSLCSS